MNNSFDTFFFTRDFVAKAHTKGPKWWQALMTDGLAPFLMPKLILPLMKLMISDIV